MLINQKEMRCMSATGMIGYGIPKTSFEAGLSKKPDFIGADMGSTDGGPNSLGSGKSRHDRVTSKKDLEMLLIAAHKSKIPLIVGSAGYAGAETHLQWTLEIINEILRERKLVFDTGIIHTEIDKEKLKSKLRSGKISCCCGHAQELTEEEIEKSTHIVHQIGPEPIIKALKKGCQLVVAGRSSDVSIFAANPLTIGDYYDRGLVYHMAKIIECGSLCAEPSGRDSIIAYLRKDHFLIESQNAQRRCTPLSVAAHALYEQDDPYYIYEPGGYLNLTNAIYEEENEKTARVSGSKFYKTMPYKVKVEGAAKVGYRVLSMAGIRDPILIDQINEVLQELSLDVKEILGQENYRLKYRLYGLNGVLGMREELLTKPYEIFIIIEAIANELKIADSVCSIATQHLSHRSYKGILGTGGNLAFTPFSRKVVNQEPFYRFNVYHLVELEDPLEFCTVEIKKMGER